MAITAQKLRERPHRLDHCMQALRMTTVPKALLWKRNQALEPPAQRQSGWR